MTTTTGTRSCPACGKSIKADATFCIYCFASSGSTAELHAAVPAAKPPLPESHGVDPSGHGEEAQKVTLQILQRRSHADAVGRRYRDAYVVAGSVVDHGHRLKVISAVVGVVGVLSSLLLTVNFGGSFGFALLVAGTAVSAVLWAVIHSQGVRTCADGQHLLASLDVAVNTSPFLDEEQKARALSL